MNVSRTFIPLLVLLPLPPVTLLCFSIPSSSPTCNRFLSRKVFLPPIGGLTIYIFGDPALIPDESVELTVRVHDECNGSDVFGR